MATSFVEADSRKQKLEDLKKKKQKELKELEKAISEAEEDAKDQQEFLDKVPIPQVATSDVSDLSPEGKEIVRMQRGKVREDGSSLDGEDEDGSESQKSSKGEVASHSWESVSELEGEIARSSVPSEEIGVGSMNHHYGAIDPNTLARVPVQELYKEMLDIYQNASDQGYVSSTQQETMYALGSAIEQKIADVESGNYTFSEQNARLASVSLSLKDKTTSLYEARKVEKSMLDEYKV